MNTEILGVVVQIALMVILSYPLGKYIAKVYKGEKTWSDFMAPIERVIYKVCGICLLYTSPSPRDRQKSRMPSSA